MSAGPVTVAIPVRNGGPLLEGVLRSVREQVLDREVELLVCDSGSGDGSVALARGFGATVLEIDAPDFSHGGTRNLLMERASGTHVAFLTQDAQPAGTGWLAALLAGFEAAVDVALVFGPYVARPGASVSVACELQRWFRSLSPDGAVRVDRLAGDQRTAAGRELLGARGYFTDANGCVLRAAWEEVPFRDVAYAEDHALAHDMLRAGWAKAFVPGAPVIHSHDYPLLGWLRRSFDEARAVREIYGYAEPSSLRRNALQVWGSVGADRRCWRATRTGASGGALAELSVLAGSTLHHSARVTGAVLGARSDRLPRSVARGLSLERR